MQMDVLVREQSAQGISSTGRERITTISQFMRIRS